MRVAIDAGHGYDTAGKRSCPFVRTITHKFDGKTVTVKKGEQYREHMGNAGVAAYLAEELKRCGFDIYKSAWDDWNGRDDKQLGSNPSSDVVERQKRIRAAKCDYSISIHFNAYGDGKNFNSGQGCETLYHSVPAKVRDGKAMAQAIQAELRDVFPDQKDRGAKGGSAWGMCNATGLGVKAAVICELAFMTNQHEAEEYFCNPEAWKKFAVGIAKGFCNYVNIPYVPEAKTSTSSASAIKAGATVTIAKGAKYGGADNGEAIPAKFTDGDKFTVTRVQTNNRQQEALLKELVSWVPVKYLSVASGGIKAGDKVTIAKGAKYGGQAKNKAVPAKFTDGDKFTVQKVQNNNGQQEALLEELVSWVPVKYLSKA